MPTTRGYVQRIYVDPGGASRAQACVFVGSSPAQVEILFLRRMPADGPDVGAIKNVMLDALTMALTARREVIVEHHPDGIYSVFFP